MLNVEFENSNNKIFINFQAKRGGQILTGARDFTSEATVAPVAGGCLLIAGSCFRSDATNVTFQAQFCVGSERVHFLDSYPLIFVPDSKFK
ncbi:hypothetical protein AVEN_239689-1 [Araneus ventricosus]|uniref:Uncharacterized protein n=1 Tax=Araneus ventricosus TaxID=182803 RepID=A0A4Y2CRJ2_ARAVE|nr:hypothetical protein AVEN_239689-1 [Araneus ventricosus]